MKLMFSIVMLLTASQIFASGSPVAYCKLDGTDKEIRLNLNRTDENLHEVLGQENEGDEFDIVTPDALPKVGEEANPSFEYERVIDAKKGKTESIAQILLPKETLGSYH